MKKIKYIIISILFFVCCTFFTNSSYALSQDEAGQIAAEFAINFYNSHGSETRYNYNNSARSQAVMNGKKVGGYYQFDCVGWISLVYQQALRLGDNYGTPYGRI